MREGDAAAREVHVGAELFEKVRAEEEVDFEFALAGDDEAHLFVGHDRDRDIFENDVAERDRVEKAELYRDRLAEKAEECSFELTEFTNRQLGCEMLGCDRQHCAGIDHRFDRATSVETNVDARHVGPPRFHRDLRRRQPGKFIDVRVRERGEIFDVPLLDVHAVQVRLLRPIERRLEVVAHVLDLRERPFDMRGRFAVRLQIECGSQMAPCGVVTSRGQFRGAERAQLRG